MNPRADIAPSLRSSSTAVASQKRTAPTRLTRELVGERRVGREQGEADVPMRQHVAPLRLQRHELDVLLYQPLPVVVGAAVDEHLSAPARRRADTRPR